MKKIVSILCIAVLLLSALATGLTVSANGANTPTVPASASKWDGVVPNANLTYEFDGSGTKDDPWLIQSATELAVFAANVRHNSKETTYSGKFFKLIVDIDMDNKEWWGIGGCEPNGDGLATLIDDPYRFRYFAGTFDGGNHKIYNFNLANHTKMEVPVKDENGMTIGTEVRDVVLHQQGLFGLVYGATIKNIGIESGNVVLENSNRTGMLLGVGRFGFQLQNCYNKANYTLTTTAKSAIAGGLIGGSWDQWSSDVNTESLSVGVYKDKLIQNCYNTGNVTVNLNQTASNNSCRVGGVAGQYVGDAPKLMNVYNIGDVTVVSSSTNSSAMDQCVGGIVGAHLNSAYIEQVYYKGKVSFTETTPSGIAHPRQGALIGRGTSELTSDADAEGNYHVGFCLLTGSTVEWAVGEKTSEHYPWIKTLTADQISIPLAENCDFIVDINVEPETPPATDNTDDSKETEESNDSKAPTTTKKPETTTAPATSNTPADTDATELSKGGCGSSIGAMSILLITGLASGTMLCVYRKKEDR